MIRWEASLPVAVYVKCEACGGDYNYTHTITEESFFHDRAGIRKKMEKRVTTDLSENSVGCRPCPFCGYTQSWMRETWYREKSASMTAILYIIGFFVSLALSCLGIFAGFSFINKVGTAVLVAITLGAACLPFVILIFIVIKSKNAFIAYFKRTADPNAGYYLKNGRKDFDQILPRIEPGTHAKQKSLSSYCPLCGYPHIKPGDNTCPKCGHVL